MGGQVGIKSIFLCETKTATQNIEMSRRYSCQSAVALTFNSI